jgi:hypothetical protein
MHSQKCDVIVQHYAFVCKNRLTLLDTHSMDGPCWGTCDAGAVAANSNPFPLLQSTKTSQSRGNLRKTTIFMGVGSVADTLLLLSLPATKMFSGR